MRARILCRTTSEEVLPANELHMKHMILEQVAMALNKHTGKPLTHCCHLYRKQCFVASAAIARMRLSSITGLDQWTGLVDWTETNYFCCV